MELETSRLALRRPRLSDVACLFTFLGNAEAMRHTHVDGSMRQCRKRIALHEHRRHRDGCAPWTVLRKSDGRMIGWGGLYHDPFDPGWGVEVGYYFHPEVWGCGYASELVAACIDIADHDLELPEVIAFADPDNLASCRVLAKAGFEERRFVPKMHRLLHCRRRLRLNP